MQSEPGRYINSVSDLYGADEIEVLLEEIRDLEPASYRPEDIQVSEQMDFEIAGSQTGVARGIPDCESPAVTVRSWDSHANYHSQLPESSHSGSLFSGVVLYCDESHLKSSTGVIRVLLLISSVACLACLCSSGTVKVGVYMLPLASRLRLMMFVTILTLLVTCLLIFLDISHILYFFPFNWGKVNALFYVSVSFLYMVSSSLIVHLIHMYHESYSWVPKWTIQQLLVTGVLGYLCAMEALLLSVVTRYHSVQYTPVDEDPSQVTLQEHRHDSCPSPPLQLQPVPAPLPTWPVDDIQPCSSKCTNPYPVP